MLQTGCDQQTLYSMATAELSFEPDFAFSCPYKWWGPGQYGRRLSYGGDIIVITIVLRLWENSHLHLKLSPIIIVIYIVYRIFTMNKTTISNFTITIFIHTISKHHDHLTVPLTLFTFGGITNITLTTCRPLVLTLERSEVLTRMTSHTSPSPSSPALHPGASHKTSWVVQCKCQS